MVYDLCVCQRLIRNHTNMPYILVFENLPQLLYVHGHTFQYVLKVGTGNA